jgi:hypothetical protein
MTVSSFLSNHNLVAVFLLHGGDQADLQDKNEICENVIGTSHKDMHHPYFSCSVFVLSVLADNLTEFV